MKGNKLFIILLAAGLMGACTSPDLADIAKTIEIPSASRSLKSSVITSLGDISVYNIVGITKCGQSLIVGRRNSECQLVDINPVTRIQKNIGIKSADRDDIAGLVSLDGNDQDGYSTFNIYKGELSEVSAQVLTRSGEREASVTCLPEEFQHLSAVRAGNYIISTGLYEKGRYLLYDPENQEGNWHLSYPENPAWPTISEQAKAVLYASTVLKVRPDHQAFVCADMYSGVIDFCRVSGNRIDLIQRHILHSPKVKVEDNGDQSQVFYSRNNRFGYSDVTVTNDRIYALYSGKTNQDHRSDFYHCQTLLVFDWSGNLLENDQLDVPLTQLVYDTDDSCIYGVGIVSGKTDLVRVEL